MTPASIATGNEWKLPRNEGAFSLRKPNMVPMTLPPNWYGLGTLAPTPSVSKSVPAAPYQSSQSPVLFARFPAAEHGLAAPLAEIAYLLYDLIRPIAGGISQRLSDSSGSKTRLSGTTQEVFMPGIPFNRPSLAGKEFEYMQEALANRHISGNGGSTKRCNAPSLAFLGLVSSPAV
jgi:hypothetical protein